MRCISMELSQAYAERMDNNDELRSFQKEVYIPENTIYLDGTSLGLLSKRAEQSLYKLLESWKTFAIDGWTEGEHPWYYLSENLGEKTSHLIRASPDDVLVTGPTSLHFHHLTRS